MTVVASRFERRENELYETESWATRALIRNYPVAGLKVWEPAAGNHKMVGALRAADAEVFASDIATYSMPHVEFDFLNGDPLLSPVESCDAIITNPPYGKGNRDAVKFAERALLCCSGMVALLLTAKFDFGKTRMHLFRDNPRFAAKIALVDRIQWFGGDMNGTEDHCWMVWRPAGEPWSPPVLLYEGREPRS